jgi:predicted metalloprotease with PDZ domain
VVLRVGGGELGDDSTALHELLHLGIPHIDLEHAWLFEGIVEYETRRARARAGTLAPERAWWELADGFERGRRAGTGRTLAEESAAMHRTRAYWRVYWAGAAIALETDVELRKCGTSLQAALARLAREHAVAVGLSLADVIAALDRGCLSAPLAKIAARELARSEFPEIAPLLAWLGVRAGEAGAKLDDRAPGSAVRDAIIPRQGFRSITPRQGFRSITPRQGFRSITPRQGFRSITAR